MKIKIRSTESDNTFICNEFDDLNFIGCEISWSSSILGIYTISLKNDFFVDKDRIKKDTFSIYNINLNRFFK